MGWVWNVLLSGYKHFDIDGFIEVVEAQDWKARANVQLWIKGAEEGMGQEPFTLVNLRRRRSERPKTPAKPARRCKAKRRTKSKGRHR